MAVDLSNRNVNAVLERAGMQPPPPEVLGQLHAACAGVEGYTDAVLDISLVRAADDLPGGEVLFVLMREKVVLVTMRKRGMFKSAEPKAITIPLATFKNFWQDDKLAEHGMVLLGRDPDNSLVFAWRSADERYRMFRALMAAHSGRYEQWGIQFDPASYVEDFDRYYAIIALEGPRQDDGWHEWFLERFGEFDTTSALGFAQEWRRCEIADAAGRQPSRRVMRLGSPVPWIDAAPDVPQVLVWLGSQLYDAGLLAPPYDERTFDTGEPIGNVDAGPARLVALMTLAAHASAIGHPRALEWTQAARAGIPAVPPTVFSPNLSTLWSQIA
jgi:hypothetical protein